MSISQYTSINFVRIFKSLADEMRLRIIRILSYGCFHVNEILFIVNGKQSNISHHLKILQDASVVINKKEGSLIYYRLNDFIFSKNILNIINSIKYEEESIPHYSEDKKRLEAILAKRNKQAEEFFNSIGQNLDLLQTKLFNKIYSLEESLRLFDKKFNKVLDIGCGTGKSLSLLSKYGKKVIGLDISPKMIQLSEHFCKEKNLNYDVKQGDIQKLPFNSESIDGILMNMVLHHISDPLIALKEINRVMTEKGKLLLIDLLEHNNEIMREDSADLWLGFSEEELIKWLTESGLKIEKKLIKTPDNNNSLEITNLSVIIILAGKNESSM